MLEAQRGHKQQIKLLAFISWLVFNGGICDAIKILFSVFCCCNTCHWVKSRGF